MIEWPYETGAEWAVHGNPLFGDGWDGTGRGEREDVFNVKTPLA